MVPLVVAWDFFIYICEIVVNDDQEVYADAAVS